MGAARTGSGVHQQGATTLRSLSLGRWGRTLSRVAEEEGGATPRARVTAGPAGVPLVPAARLSSGRIPPFAQSSERIASSPSPPRQRQPEHGEQASKSLWRMAGDDGSQGSDAAEACSSRGGRSTHTGIGGEGASVRGPPQKYGKGQGSPGGRKESKSVQRLGRRAGGPVRTQLGALSKAINAALGTPRPQPPWATEGLLKLEPQRPPPAATASVRSQTSGKSSKMRDSADWDLESGAASASESSQTQSMRGSLVTPKTPGSDAFAVRNSRRGAATTAVAAGGPVLWPPRSAESADTSERGPRTQGWARRPSDPTAGRVPTPVRKSDIGLSYAASTVDGDPQHRRTSGLDSESSRHSSGLLGDGFERSTVGERADLSTTAAVAIRGGRSSGPARRRASDLGDKKPLVMGARPTSKKKNRRSVPGA